MLVSGGKILALSEVKKDNTLAGNGTPNSPLGVSESYTTSAQDWVRNYVSAVAGDTIPYSGVDPYITINDHKVAFNSAGFATQQWVEEKNYAKKSDLEPYALTSAVNQKFVDTSSWANKKFQPSGDYATKTDVKTSADNIITWVQNNYWTSAKTSQEIDERLSKFGYYPCGPNEIKENGEPDETVLNNEGKLSTDKIYLVPVETVATPDKSREYVWNGSSWRCIGDTSMDLEPYAKTSAVNAQFSATSAWALATFHQPSGNYVTSAEFEDYKTAVEQQFNDTAEWATETFQPKGEYVSASDFAELVEDVHELEENVVEEFENTSAWAERTFQPVGEYVSASDFAKLTEDVNGLSADFTDYKAEVEQKFEDTSSWANDTFQPKGNYVSAEPFNTWAEGVDDALDTINDNFQSISADLENISAGLEKKLDTEDFEAWQEGKDFTSYSAGDGIDVQNHLISLASSALDNYYKKNETSAASAISAEFAKYQLAGEYITSADADERYLPKDWSADKDVQPYEGDGEYIKVEDHKIILDKVPQVVSVSSTDNSVDVSEVPTPEGIMYDLSVKPVDETVISGENGVSAKYDEVEKAWLVGLSENSSYDYAEAKQSSGQALYAERTVLANFSSTSIVGDGIAVVPATGVITLKRGLYHIDMQVDVTVAANPQPEYNSISLELANYSGGTAGSTIKSVIHELDVSYAHTETISVSFDFQVNEQRNVVIALDQFGAGVGSARVRNFNIHEVVTIDGILNGDIAIYNAGPGISIDDDVQGKMILVNAGPGLSADPITNKLCVACGSGLKIDEQGGVMAVTLDEMTEQVVETVQQMEKDMESKITTNFPQAGITITNSYVPAGSNSQYQSNKGYVYGNLFNIAMNHKIEIGKTHLGVYCKQNDNQNKYILGIYEYQPDYDRGDGTFGRTVAKCDTGFVEILPGFHEYPVVHLNNTIGTTSAETDDTMSTNNFYYAAIFFPRDRNGMQGLWLGSAPGYNTQLNECKPQLMCAYNDIPANVGAAYSADLSFNDFGFTWAYEDYTQKTTTHSTTAPMECFDSMRFFMQIRNHQ